MNTLSVVTKLVDDTATNIWLLVPRAPEYNLDFVTAQFVFP